MKKAKRIRIITLESKEGKKQIIDIKELPVTYTKSGKFDSNSQDIFNMILEDLESGLEVKIENAKIIKGGKMKTTFKLHFDTEWGEYQVQVFENGILNKERTYHTDTLQDAVDTRKAMEKEERENG